MTPESITLRLAQIKWLDRIAHTLEGVRDTVGKSYSFPKIIDDMIEDDEAISALDDARDAVDRYIHCLERKRDELESKLLGLTE